MVKTPTAPECPIKCYDQKLFTTDGTQTLTYPNLTLEPLDQFQSVLHENNLEFSGQSIGKTSDSPRLFL